MKDSKWTRFLRKYSRNLIAFATVLALLVSGSSIATVVLLIRSARSQESTKPTELNLETMPDFIPKPGNKPENKPETETTPPVTTDPTESTLEPFVPNEKLTPEEELEQSITLLTDAIKKNPKDPDLYIQRASFYYNLGKSEAALDDYSRALVLEDDPETRYLRAIVYTVSGNSSAAYTDLAAALKALPNHPDYLSLMADTCNALQKYSESQVCLEKLLATDPYNCTLHTLAADACVYQNKFSEAVTHYEQAIANYSDAASESGISKASLYSAYGNSLKNVNRFPEAADAYSQCLSYGENKELYFQRGFCLLQAENYADAAADFTKCIELGYETALAHFQRGLCRYASESYGDAIEDFKIYEGAYPNSTDTFIYMGLCHQNLKAYESAIPYYNKCIDANISPGTCHFNIGNCYYNQENYSSAVSSFTHAIDSGSYVYESLLNRGVCYIKLNKYNEAKADLKRVIDECPDSALVESAKKSYDPIKNITIITKG